MADCGFGIIHWCSFDWPSFATLATGFAAVFAAWLVGRKQAYILSRQTDLEEAKLRADLFERRFATYEATADFLVHIGAMPETDAQAEERIKLFGVKVRESQFLFSDPNVYRTLNSFFDKGNEVRSDRAISAAEHEEGIKHDPARTKKLMEYPNWMFEKLETLADLFRHDLSILKEKVGR